MKRITIPTFTSWIEISKHFDWTPAPVASVIESKGKLFETERNDLPKMFAIELSILYASNPIIK
jgi:hypothetical protein